MRRTRSRRPEAKGEAEATPEVEETATTEEETRWTNPGWEKRRRYSFLPKVEVWKDLGERRDLTQGQADHRTQGPASPVHCHSA